MIVSLAGPWGEAKLLRPRGDRRHPVGDDVTVHVPRQRLHLFGTSGERL